MLTPMMSLLVLLGTALQKSTMDETNTNGIHFIVTKAIPNLCYVSWATVNKERFAGLNFCGF